LEPILGWLVANWSFDELIEAHPHVTNADICARTVREEV